MRRTDLALSFFLAIAIAACSRAPQANTASKPTANPPRTPVATPAPAEPQPVPVPQEDQAQDQQAAREVVVDYYTAIDAGDYRKAYGAWSDGGAASGQTYELFSGGYANTRGVQADVGEATQVEGAAGSRYTTVPVQLAATQADGGERHYRGRFTLRKVMADGATATQRQWHLYSAEMQRVDPP